MYKSNAYKHRKIKVCLKDKVKQTFPSQFLEITISNSLV